MGTRVVTAIKSGKGTSEDKIFFCNTTSFNVEETVKSLANNSETKEELVTALSNFSKNSDIAKREEKFWSNVEYPFGDFEYIIYVDKELNVSKINLEEYSKICGKSIDDLYNLEFA